MKSYEETLNEIRSTKTELSDIKNTALEQHLINPSYSFGEEFFYYFVLLSIVFISIYLIRSLFLKISSERKNLFKFISSPNIILIIL